MDMEKPANKMVVYQPGQQNFPSLFLIIGINYNIIWFLFILVTADCETKSWQGQCALINERGKLNGFK